MKYQETRTYILTLNEHEISAIETGLCKISEPNGVYSFVEFTEIAKEMLDRLREEKRING